MSRFIYDRPEWPRFRWDQKSLVAPLAAVRHRQGRLVGRMEALGFSLRSEAVLKTLTLDVLKSSEIEGEILNRSSVQSSIQRQLGLAADKRRATPAEQGIAEMMVDLFRSSAEPISNEMLYRWHRMVASGRRDLIDIGRYRTGK